MNILLIDNNDSFTYNIVEMLRQVGKSEFSTGKFNIIVRSVDDFDLNEVAGADKVIISPGPGLPKDYPVLFEMLDKYAALKSILGICMGQQVICEFFGAKLFNLPQVVHGQPRNIQVSGKNSVLFDGLTQLRVGLYHSWAVDAASLPDELKATAFSGEGVLMAVSHQEWDIHAVQFHPESYITENGRVILENFLAFDQ